MPMGCQCTQLDARSALAKPTQQQLGIIKSPREHCSTSAQRQCVGRGWLGRVGMDQRASARPVEVAALPISRPGSRLGVRTGRADGAAATVLGARRPQEAWPRRAKRYTTDPLKRPNGLYVGEIHERASERRGGSLDPANRAQSGGGVRSSRRKSVEGVDGSHYFSRG